MIDEILMFLAGMYFYYNLSIHISLYKKRKSESKTNKIFTEILSNLKTGIFQFTSRLDTKIDFNTTLLEHGNVVFIWFVDKKQIAIFKGPDCLCTDINCNKKIKKEIIDYIQIKFKEEINDVVTIPAFGTVIDRRNFEILKLCFKSPQNEITNQIPPLSIDYILDRINEVGYDKLTDEEKDFLQKKSKT